ncbi:Cdc6-like AAA superfamily ATPase [Streptococcus gallinaceus]|uniref:FtsK/SpoIIIE domain-containing protein n=1 Tax=Streptococcus gallinaceus TaxID=165758 RepID=UPI00209E85A8|nr:FtsK/SpoIIIE domain-containing protein [Streptococcus gallinaceus]MCP1640397.1 Cdc6-like AAA superfamily ATPase [Streptococcus gallinaceus]MCP1771180.1 Cdc6-like AAA superfamily ATPase [Streptococcus gallinaceus]
MLSNLIKEAVSPLLAGKSSKVYISVDKTKEQRRQSLLFKLKLIACIILLISIMFFLRINKKQLLSLSLEKLSYIPLYIGFVILLIVLICVSIWLFLHSRFSPLENRKLLELLKNFAEESDILRKHKSEIDSTQSIRWVYWLESGLIHVILYHGGHVNKSKLEDIPDSLLGFFIKETRNKWYLEDRLISDGCVKMIFSHKPDEQLTIGGYEDFRKSRNLNIRLTERLNWTLKQPMGLVVGPTNSGKTSLLKYLILAFLINNPKNQVYTIDGKAAYLSTAMKIIGKVAINGEQAYQMVYELNELMEQRYKELTSDDSSEEDITHHEKFNQGQILLVVDELLALATTMQAEDKQKKPVDRLYPQFNSLLLNLIVKGRQANINVLVSGQMIPTSILPSEARDSLGLRIALGRITQSQATEIFNMSKNDLPHANTSNYEGVIFLDGLGLEHPIVFKTPFYDDSKLPFKGALRVLQFENQRS